jgi:hypothetical protein
MPFYDFENVDTGEIETHSMSYKVLDKFKEDNPHLQQRILSAPKMVSGTGVKNDEGWKENLTRIAEAHPTSALADRLGGRKTKEVKTQEVAKKHGRLKNGKYTMSEL